MAGRYTFAHALIEHALYDDLSAGRRGACPPEGRGGARGALRRRSRPSGSGSSPTTGLTPPSPRTRARRSRTRNGRAIGPWRSSRPTRRCAGTGTRSICSTGSRATTRAVGPRCSSGSATRNDRRVIPTHRETLLAAGRLADDVDAVDLLVRAALRNNRGWNSIAGGVDHERIEMLTRALTRLGDADSPDRARLLALLCVERTWDADFDERLSMATRGRRHRAADRRQRRAGRRDSTQPRVDHDAPDPRAPPAMEHRGVRARRRSRRPDRTPPRQRGHGCLTALEAGDVATMRDRTHDLRVGMRADRTAAQPLADRVPLARGDGCSKATSTPPKQAATEALTLGTAAGYPGRRAHLLWRPAHGPALDAGPPARDDPAHRAGRATDSPALDIFRAVLACAKSFDGAHDEVRQLLDTEVANDFPMFADATWLAAHTIWAMPSRAAAIDRRRRSSINASCRGTTSSRPHTSTSQGSVAHYLGLLAHTLDRHDEAEQWFEPGARVARSDGSAVLRRVDPDRMGGPPRRPQPARGRTTGAGPRRRRATGRDRATDTATSSATPARCSNGSSSHGLPPAAEASGWVVRSHRTTHVTSRSSTIGIEPFLHEDFFFVNIGANDGVMNDQIYPFIREHSSRHCRRERTPRIRAAHGELFRDLPGVMLRTVRRLDKLRLV